jgi:trimethylguanosine synthase
VLDKYWAQRKRLFTKFDEGITLDGEGWFSVTPESIANHIAQKLVMYYADNKSVVDSTSDPQASSGLVVLDAFSGMGGNSIAFARREEVSLVICVDTDVQRLRLAANNCRVYGIEETKIVFIHGDACQVLSNYKEGTLVNGIRETRTCDTIHGYKCGHDLLPRRLDAIFLSPPWGGAEYQSIGPRHFGLDCIHVNDAVDGEEILRLASAALPPNRQHIVYFLPRNLNGLSLAQSAHRCGIRGYIEIEQNILNGKLKTLTVYMKCLHPKPSRKQQL